MVTASLIVQGSRVLGYLRSTEKLHAKQGKNKNEKEQQEYQTDNGLDAVDQRDDQIAHGGPVSEEGTNCVVITKLRGEKMTVRIG